MNSWRQPCVVVLLLTLIGAVESSADAPALPADPTTRTTAKLFSRWVDLADRHRAEWQQASPSLTPEQRSAAILLADELFGGMLGGYWNSWTGFEQASGAHFVSRPRVQRAPDEIVEPARSYLLWRMSAIQADNARKALGDRAGDDPVFWEAYGRHVAHGNHFGFLRERAAYVIPRLMAEGTLGDAWHREGVYSPTAAQAMLASARWQLERALQRFERGDVAAGLFFVTDAARSMRRARSFGMGLDAVRTMLLTSFGERLVDDRTVTLHEGRRLSFREALQDGIVYMKHKADRQPGFNLNPLAELYLEEVDDRQVEGVGGLEEEVLVTAAAATLNVEGYLFRELEVLVDDVAGRPVLRRYADLELLGKLLFFALLTQEATAGDYARIRESSRQQLVGEHGATLSERQLTRRMIDLGSRLLMLPGTVQELRATRHGTKLIYRLAVFDSLALQALATPDD